MVIDPPLSSSSVNWSGYYEAVAGRPPRDTLIVALDAWEQEFPEAPRKFGVDLACGEGRDTAEFLRRGWRVLAIDAEPLALELLRSRDDLPEHGELEIRLGAMETSEWNPADVINASFALPFCPPDNFTGVWKRICGTLRPGGRFAGQLFGPKDDWANPHLTIADRDRVERLLYPFDVEVFEEIDRDGKDANGRSKHWHLFNIVARIKNSRVTDVGALTG